LENKKINLFDSNCHPTANGTWLNKQKDNSISNLIKSIRKNKIIGAFAVGLNNIDNYSHFNFIKMAKKSPLLIPIAGVNPIEENTFEDYYNLKKMGFAGIKIHPRFSKINLEENKSHIINTLQICADLKLKVLFCTYFEENGRLIIESPLMFLDEIIHKCYKTKIILMHSGYDKFKDYFNLLSGNDNILFDFSYTIMSIKSDSTIEDIKEVFNNYNSLICVGSDWPEYGHEDLLFNLSNYCSHLSQKMMDKICHSNILNFINEAD